MYFCALKMKKLIQLAFIGIILLSSANLIAQATVNQTDAKGRKQGFWRKNFENGKVRYEGNFKDDQPDGVFRYYLDSGELKMVSFFSQKGKKSYTKGFDSKGNIISEGVFIDKQKDSVWTYYNEVHNPVLRESYDHGKRVGTWYVYYPHGQVSEETNYVNDQRHGPWIQYYEDGVKRLTANYKNDLLHGKISYFYANGKPQLMGNYVDDLRQGTWYHFEENGNIKETEVFKDGVSDKLNIQKFEKLDVDEEKLLNTPPGQ
jgi:antitoxin component YwqK of YwqJK toxin-antitoxin module